MNVLFLDDKPSRTACFKSQVPSAMCVETAKAAIVNLVEADWDTVYLDHDLGGDEMSASDALSGMEVVRWIVANKPIISTIVVHSLNKSAAEEMVAKLQDAGYSASWIPFGWMHVALGD